jgi:hypothetical protein
VPEHILVTVVAMVELEVTVTQLPGVAVVVLEDIAAMVVMADGVPVVATECQRQQILIQILPVLLVQDRVALAAEVRSGHMAVLGKVVIESVAVVA